jgi:hypothetical protein
VTLLRVPIHHLVVSLLPQVYLTGDEKSEESLNFFQEHGYKTRLDAAVVRGHLRPSDAAFLDYLLCRNSTLFIGNSNSKISKQIVALREAVELPSFVLKSADGAETRSEALSTSKAAHESSTRPPPSHGSQPPVGAAAVESVSSASIESSSNSKQFSGHREKDPSVKRPS